LSKDVKGNHAKDVIIVQAVDDDGSLHFLNGADLKETKWKIFIVDVQVKNGRRECQDIFLFSFP
jgi:hypothetical protein